MLVLICVASIGQHGLMLTGSPDFCTTMIRGTDFKIFGNVAIKRIVAFTFREMDLTINIRELFYAFPLAERIIPIERRFF